MKNKRIFSAAIALAVSVTTHASSITLEGDYILTAVSENGTLGAGGVVSPGIIHDPSGSGIWSIDDYLTPGSPFEGFYVKSDQTGIKGNNNSGQADIAMSELTDTSNISGYDNSVFWAGNYDSYFGIETTTYFNNGDERIAMTAKITALQNLTNVEFLRTLDADPDVKTFYSYDTVNGRGSDSLPAEDWVHSEGTETGLTIGLYTNSNVTHNTGVSSGWSTDPDFFLDGINNGNGDNTIGLAFDLGTLSMGDFISFDYFYVMGDSLATVDIPSPVPEPTSIALLALGLAGIGARRFKKRA